MSLTAAPTHQNRRERVLADLDVAVEQPDVLCGIHLGLLKGMLEEITSIEEPSP